MIRPVIGIVGKYYKDEKTGLWSNNYASQELIDFITSHYATPIIIPLHSNSYMDDVDYDNYKIGESSDDDSYISNILGMCDGIILQGGTNSSYIEPRIVQLCMDYYMPVLGICAGFNNIARAIADLPLRKLDKEDKQYWYHNKEYADYRHHISIFSGTILHSVVSCKGISVNSIHEMVLDYSIARLNDNIETMAICESDLTVEAFSVKGTTYTVALKWHPELMKGNRYSIKILRNFVDECRHYHTMSY